MYVKLTNGKPEIYTIKKLHRDNSNISFPKIVPYAVLAEYDVYPVTVSDRPTTEVWQRAVQDELPTQDQQGNWVIGWTVVNIPATVEMVKEEAQRRIYEILPDWKQRNLTARAAELAIKGVQNWSLEEQAEVAAGQALWDQIKVIRAKSDELEAMDPIPVDYIDDKYWM